MRMDSCGMNLEGGGTGFLWQYGKAALSAEIGHVLGHRAGGALPRGGESDRPNGNG